MVLKFTNPEAVLCLCDTTGIYRWPIISSHAGWLDGRVRDPVHRSTWPPNQPERANFLIVWTEPSIHKEFQIQLKIFFRAQVPSPGVIVLGGRAVHPYFVGHFSCPCSGASLCLSHSLPEASSER